MIHTKRPEIIDLLNILDIYQWKNVDSEIDLCFEVTEGNFTFRLTQGLAMGAPWVLTVSLNYMPICVYDDKVVSSFAKPLAEQLAIAEAARLQKEEADQRVALQAFIDQNRFKAKE